MKGAYWDTEIKLAQVQGYTDYPVFTRKAATDVSWLACAARMLDARDAIYPAFATHNAHSLASCWNARDRRDFEMQRLHGMGEALYHDVGRCPVRVYAPVGTHEDLLAYLVRRLLENGANTSFVHRLVDPAVPEDAIIADPVGACARGAAAIRAFRCRASSIPIGAIPPASISPTARQRAGAAGGDLQRSHAEIRSRRRAADPQSRRSARASSARQRRRRRRDRCATATRSRAAGAPGTARAARIAPRCCERAADAIEAARDELLSLLAREGGKTLADGIAEVREAADFCRWYALQAPRAISPRRASCAGPTGERNTWALGGRGVFACHLAVELPAGDLHRPDRRRAGRRQRRRSPSPPSRRRWSPRAPSRCCMQAGVPRNALRLLPGDGERSARRWSSDPRIAGVAFTGGTETAQGIARALAARPGPIVPFIAETGGINAMIVDSSALAEQVVTDVLACAFGSAGQRCSALRLLCLQEDIADRVLRHAARRDGDAGDRRSAGSRHRRRPGDRRGGARRCERAAQPTRRAAVRACRCRPAREHGSFFAPRAYLLRHAGDLATRRSSARCCTSCATRPIGWTTLMDAIEATGYGLTLGIHSRIESGAAAHRAIACASATPTSTATRSAPWSACSRSAAGAFRHRPEGRRSGHALSICRRARHIHQHRSRRRQCRAARLGRRIGEGGHK